MTETGFDTIDQYIATQPANIQTILQKVRECIAHAAPGASEAIRYRLPTFILGRSLVHFGAFKEVTAR